MHETISKNLIHPLTSIHPDAKIGENVVIEAFATVKGDVVIGDGCWIGSNVVIDNGARIGKNTKIFPGAVIATIPQDLKFGGEYTTVEIGNNCIIREYVTVNRGTTYSGTTKVGNNVLIMAYAHVAHDCVLGDHVILANAVNLAGHVVIDEHAIIGGTSAIHQFVRIGRHSILQGGSLVGKDVPPFTKGARYPLSYVGVNTVGLKRRGYDSEQIHQIHEIYRLLFASGRNTTQALEAIEAEIPDSDFRREILDFVRSSPRGVMKGVAKKSTREDD